MGGLRRPISSGLTSRGWCGKLLEKAGLEFVGMLDAGTMKEPEANAQRIYFIARECTKKG